MSKHVPASDALYVIAAVLDLADAFYDKLDRELPPCVVQLVNVALSDKQLKHALVGASGKELDLCESMNERLEAFLDDAPAGKRLLDAIRRRYEKEHAAKAALAGPESKLVLGVFPAPPRRKRGKIISDAPLFDGLEGKPESGGPFLRLLAV